MKKSILALVEWYYPEIASTAQLSKDLFEYLNQFYNVTILAKVPCYSGEVDPSFSRNKIYIEQFNGVRTILLPMKSFNKSSKKSRIFSLIHYFLEAKKTVKKLGKFDCVFAMGQPPLFGSLLAYYAKRKTGGKLVYNIQDFCPESIRAVGYFKFDLLLDFVQFIDNKTCRKSDMVVVVGRDMQETLNNRFKNKQVPRNVVINNWIDDENVIPLLLNNPGVVSFKKQYNLEKTFNVVYSGNLGLFYDLPNLVKLLTRIRIPNVRFVFIGDGAEKKHIEEIVTESKSPNFVFIPYQKKDQLVYSLNAADIHFVFSAKGFKGVSVPSKIYGILAVNKPVIGIMEEGSEAYNVIKESNSGQIFAPGDYQNIEKGIRQILNNCDDYIKEHSCGRKFLENNLSKGKSLNEYKKVIDSLVQ